MIAIAQQFKCVRYLIVDDPELPRPLGVVQELAVVEAVVVRAVALGVVRRRQYCHLVAVYRIVTEEMLHFVRNLSVKESKISLTFTFQSFFGGPLFRSSFTLPDTDSGTNKTRNLSYT